MHMDWNPLRRDTAAMRGQGRLPCAKVPSRAAAVGNIKKIEGKTNQLHPREDYNKSSKDSTQCKVFFAFLIAVPRVAFAVLVHCCQPFNPTYWGD